MRRFVSPTGERFSILINELGIPLYYPSAYVAWRLRSRSLSASSIANALGVIKVIHEWQFARSLDLEEMFSRRACLTEGQLRDLCDYLQLVAGGQAKSSIPSRSRKRLFVGSSTHYFRLTVASSYISFMAECLSVGSGAEAIRSMRETIKANRPCRPGRSIKDRDEISLDEKIIERVTAVLRPGSLENPVRDYAVQLRNYLMFMLLGCTGMRRGELLNLKVSDFDFGQQTMKIVRRPDAKSDPRKLQPAVKTLGRVVPITPELLKEIYDYVLLYRSRLSRAKKHGYLFVTHKQGPSCGHPLSIPAFQKWMAAIQKVSSGENVHAHALRHHWNYRFSLLMDNQKVSPEREAKIRSYLMGWSETSGTAYHYNKRHIKKQAAAAITEMQERILNNLSEA